MSTKEQPENEGFPDYIGQLNEAVGGLANIPVARPEGLIQDPWKTQGDKWLRYPETNAEGRPLIPVEVPHRVREILHSIAQQVQEAHMLGWFVGVGYEPDQPLAMRHNHIVIDAQPHLQNHYSKKELEPKAVEIRTNIKTGPFYE